MHLFKAIVLYFRRKGKKKENSQKRKNPSAEKPYLAKKERLHVRRTAYMSLANESKPDRKGQYVDLLRKAPATPSLFYPIAKESVACKASSHLASRSLLLYHKKHICQEKNAFRHERNVLEYIAEGFTAFCNLF